MEANTCGAGKTDRRGAVASTGAPVHLHSIWINFAANECDRTMEQVIYGPNVDINKKKLQHVHDVMSLVLGVGAGVLTLESIWGFLMYTAGLTLTNVVFYIFVCAGRPRGYFPKPVQGIFVDGILGNLAGYVMMWCLVYALVK